MKKADVPKRILTQGSYFRIQNKPCGHLSPKAVNEVGSLGIQGGNNLLNVVFQSGPS